MAPATRTTVADESAPLSMEITGAAAAASVGLEIAQSLLLLEEEEEEGRGAKGSDDEGLAATRGARARGALTAAREACEGSPAGRATAAAAQEEERKSMKFGWAREKKKRKKVERESENFDVESSPLLSPDVNVEKEREKE